MKKDLIIKLCRRVVNNENLNVGDFEYCDGIDCYKDSCPFGKSFNCVLADPIRLEIAKKYLKDNGIKEENKMEKTFREVIADIKVGEVWEITKGNNIEISLSKNGVTLDFKKSIECEKIFFPNDTKFKLKREEYTFEEAFKAYEEGKEVESCNFRYKKIEGKDSYYDQIIDNWENRYDVDFSLEEIRNKWYIND